MIAVFTSILTLTRLRRFRWVYCQIEALRRCFPARIQHTLDELPLTLDGTYEETLRRIDKQTWDYAHRLFQCLVVSERPLRVGELAELFAIQTSAETIPTFDSTLRPEDPEKSILSACSTLVAVVNVDGENIVQFSHFSVREYLTSDRIADSTYVSRFHIHPQPAHVFLTRACLGVLLQLDDRVDRDNIQNFPLASYAAQYWVDHAPFENVPSDIRDGMECLFDKNKPHFAAWLWLYNIDDPFDILMATSHPARPETVPLYYAALCGFRATAERLIDTHPQDVNARGGQLVTPLHAALEKGHLTIAALLVERGASANLQDDSGWTALHLTLLHGHNDIIQSLLDHGADTNLPDNFGWTALLHASREGHNDIVQLLLDHDADINHPDDCGWTPLHHASRKGHIDTVRLLLNHGTANHPDNRGRTPLLHASLRGHNDTIQLLLDHGADANHSDNCGWTPLHHVLQEGHINIARLLLDGGAGANHPDNCGCTPLHLASRDGHSDIVQLLLDHSADMNHPDNCGWTPLHHASRAGHNDTVQLLLDHGAIANHRDNRGYTPLRHASLWGHDDIVQLLLDQDAVPNHLDNRG